MVEDKRQYLRLPVHSTVFIELEAPRLGTTGPGRIARCKTLDVSRGGLRVALEQELAVGAILQIGVELDAIRETLYLAGEVMWCRHLSEPEPHWFAGFAILNADDSDIDRWVGLLTDMRSLK